MSPLGRSTCIQELEPTDFYAKKHATLFNLIRSMDDGTVDLLTVYERLRATGAEDDVGGMMYLTTLMNSVVAANVPDAHVRIVKDKSQRRRLITALQEALHRTRDELHPIDDVQSYAERQILEVREPPKEEQTAEDWAALVESESALVEAGLEGRRRILTGYHELDKRLRLYPKKLSVLAAGTSQGKSAQMLAIAVKSSLYLGQRTYIWSGEMDRTELWERMCASELSISYERVQERTLNQTERDAIKGLMARVKASPLTVRDDPKTVMDIRADCRYLRRTQGQIDLVIVDYLALLKELNQETEGNDRRDVRIGIVIWNLIQMARELDCHVLLLHQLNRAKDARPIGRPRVSDLKDSSTIEQHAHNVLLLYRPERDESLSEDVVAQYRDMLEFIIGKQRSGKVGSTWLTFIGDKQQIINLAPSQWPKVVTDRKGR